MKEQEIVTVGVVACLVVCGWVMMTWAADWVGGWAVALFLAADGVRWCWSPCVMCCAVLCCVWVWVTTLAAGVPVCGSDGGSL
jgi:hypothetical protein